MRASKNGHVEAVRLRAGGNILTRQCTLSGVFSSCPCRSRLNTVSRSCIQSEYQALNAWMQEIVWLLGVLSEVQFWMNELTPFSLDNRLISEFSTTSTSRSNSIGCGNV